MTVTASITHPGGKSETRGIGSAEEFRRLLDVLHKKAHVSLDGGRARQVREWRGDRGSWPWTNGASTNAIADGDAHEAGHEQPATSPTRASTSVAAPSPRALELAEQATRDVARLDERVATLSDAVAKIDAQMEPVPERIDRLGGDVDRRVVEESARLRGELRETLQDELRPVIASIAGLAEAVRARPEKDEIAGLVDQAVAPAEARLGSALVRLREEHELLAEEGEEQRRRMRAYRPGTIEELRQRLEEVRQQAVAGRAELVAAHTRIDQLERDNAHLKESTGAVDRDELRRIREQIAKERDELDSARQLAADRDELRGQLEDYRRLEHRYQAAQAVQARDQQREEQLRAAEKAKFDLEHELAAANDGLRQSKRQLDKALKARGDLQQSNLELTLINEQMTAEARERAEKLEALEQAARLHDEERTALATARRELTASRTKDKQALVEARQALDDEARQYLEAQDTLHRDRMDVLEEHHERQREALEARLRAELVDTHERELRAVRHERDVAVEARDHALTQAKLRRDEWATMCDQHTAWLSKEQERALALRRHEAMVADLATREDELRTLIAQQETGLSKTRVQVQEVTETLATLEAREQGVRARLADIDHQYRDELGLVRALHEERKRLEEPATRDVRMRSMVQAVPDLRPAAREPAPEGLAEMKWLDAIAERMEASGFIFPRRLLEAFHTSVKIPVWSPLTVLAGASGTGKSALARLYSHFGGLRFHMVPVQPNWDSPQDLFGFFNHVDGLYKATPLIRALVQSQRDAREDGFVDGLLLVTLDEMNLARLENYGSELLSRWEARRDGVEPEALQIDIGHGEYEPVTLGTNVLWVGTMNEDETTQSLSDKVLERGNVITFPRPRSLKRREQAGLTAAGPWLSRHTVDTWRVEPSSLDPKVRDTLKEAVEELNHLLGFVQRSVSHRTLQAIENYVANHPRVRGQAARDSTGRWWQQAFADQLVQKVMPKLRGVDTHTGDGKRCLGGFADVLGTHAEVLAADFREAMKSPQFLWTSSAYLERDQDRG